ncbi:MAG: hypothetical protein Q7S40_25265 [Opitutaceae bacterium]|nr:hypothetical protein [Opitutaceae bacterium]
MKPPRPSAGFIPELVPSPSPAPPKRITVGKFYIYQEPRISAAKLAEYAVASPARQKTLAQNAKIAPTLLLAPYREARDTLSHAHTHNGINAGYLLRVADEIEKRVPEKDWQKAENPRCVTALRRLAKVADQVECEGGHLIHRPSSGWGGIKIAGVYVSINPELVFSVDHRGVRKVGGVILNTGQGPALSLDRSHDDHSVGDYLTTLLFCMLEMRLNITGIPLHTRCYAIDIARERIHTAPASHKRLLKNLEAACEIIAMRWDKIDVSAVTERVGGEEEE